MKTDLLVHLRAKETAERYSPLLEAAGLFESSMDVTTLIILAGSIANDAEVLARGGAGVAELPMRHL